MIDESQLENLKERLESIERLLENFIYRDAKLALKNALDDPNTAASKAGIAIEGLLGVVYRKIAEEKGEKISDKPLAIEELKACIGKIGGEIPRTILRNIDLIQQYRNEGSHSRVETVKSGELGSVLSALLNVLVWYLEDVRKEKLDFSEIGLKNKEKQYIDFVTMALSDGVISNSEREFLNTKIRELGISFEKAKFIEEEILQKFGKPVSSLEVQVQNPSLHSEDTTLNRREARVLEDCQEQIFHENNTQVALKELQPLVQKYPKNKEVSELYAICLKDKDLNSALQYLKGISKKSHLEYRLFVEVLGELGEFNSAFDELEEMGKLFPGESDVLQIIEAHLNILEYKTTNRNKLLETAENLTKDSSATTGYSGFINALVKFRLGTMLKSNLPQGLELYYKERILYEKTKQEPVNNNRMDESLKIADGQNVKEKIVTHGRRVEEDKIDLVEGVSTSNIHTNSLGMEFVLIPAGEFMMGAVPEDNEAYDDEKPQHKVLITKPFYMGKYLVTQGEWEKLMGNNPSEFKKSGMRAPVENVSWLDCQGFIKKLNQKESKIYRLPTEAEWEYSARAGMNSIFISGNSDKNLNEFAWDFRNSGSTTHPVGELKPNLWGLYDMIGNILEWCEDSYSENYYKKSPSTDPLFKEEFNGRIDRAVQRGGDAFDLRRYESTIFHRFSARHNNFLREGYNNCGFRIVLSL